MRKIHRWLSILAALFLLVVATTGVILQAQKLTGEDEDHDAEEHEALSVTADAYASMLTVTLQAAQARAPSTPISSIELRMTGEEPEGVVTYPGEPGRQIVVDARDGKVLKDEEHEGESIFMRIHSGEIFGEPGVVMGLLWGSALVILSLTGIIMYITLYRQRRKASGKGGLFW